MKKENNIPDFKVPEDYFETFEERLFSKMAVESFPKAAGFRVPETYFEGLEERVCKTVILEKPKKVIPLFPKKYFGYAATLAACLVIGFAIFTNNPDQSSLDALQLAAIDTYIEEGNLNLDLYDVTSYIEDADISNIDLDVEQFSESALKDYLLENLDAETIINEE